MESYSAPRSSKRQYNELSLNGREKRAALEDVSGLPPGSQETVFRMLCPSSRTGSIIGKGGSIIKILREETGSRIKIADAVPGIDERVVIVSGIDVPHQEWSAAQEGLLRVHARVFDIPPEENGGVPVTGPITTRLLVPTAQIGCILGKGGSIVSQIRKESGSQVRIMPRDQLPGCALATDELVQVVGDMSSVVKALEMMTAQLRANPPREKPVSSYPSPAPLPTYPSSPLVPPTTYALTSSSPPDLRDNLGFQMAQGPVVDFRDVESMEVVFRLLCSSAKIGSIIGVGGTIIKQLRDATGAKIKIADAVPDVDERVVIISGNERPGSQISPAQDAAFLVQSQLLDHEAQEPGFVVTTRLLVPANQIGCLLGKGGAIISEMRRTSHANIRILSRDQLPGCALDTDELVQITGDADSVRHALHQVTNRLRTNPPRDGPPSALASKYLPERALRQVGATEGDGYHTENLNSSAYRSSSEYASDGFYGDSTIYVPIPASAIGSVIGKAGANIAHIRHISGSRVKLHDLEEDGTERILEINGTSDQLDAAQKLLQAIILNGTAPGLGGQF